MNKTFENMIIVEDKSIENRLFFERVSSKAPGMCKLVLFDRAENIKYVYSSSDVEITLNHIILTVNLEQNEDSNKIPRTDEFEYALFDTSIIDLDGAYDFYQFSFDFDIATLNNELMSKGMIRLESNNDTYAYEISRDYIVYDR